MNPYPKIETLFNRDDKFKVVEGDYRRDEFSFIDLWAVTEKIDGTNIRLSFWRDPFESNTVTSAVRGKSDSAQVPQPLLDTLTTWCHEHTEAVGKIMEQHDLMTYCLYGEGYGPKIQSGGYYRDDQAFILFDVNAGGTWLAPDQVNATATDLGIDVVPSLGVLTTHEIVNLVAGRKNKTSFAKEEREAEGVVARTVVPLYDRRGERVMWKLKGKDFA